MQAPVSIKSNDFILRLFETRLLLGVLRQCDHHRKIPSKLADIWLHFQTSRFILVNMKFYGYSVRMYNAVVSRSSAYFYSAFFSRIIFTMIRFEAEHSCET